MLGILSLLTGIMRGLLLGGKSVTQATCALAGKLASICYHVIKDGVYKGVVKKSFRVPKVKQVDVKDVNVGEVLDSLSQ